MFNMLSLALSHPLYLSLFHSLLKGWRIFTLCQWTRCSGQITHRRCSHYPHGSQHSVSHIIHWSRQAILSTSLCLSHYFFTRDLAFTHPPFMQTGIMDCWMVIPSITLNSFNWLSLYVWLRENKLWYVECIFSVHLVFKILPINFILFKI